MDRPQYVNWIVREAGVVFEDQQPLNCYRLSYVIDDAILDDWALHIRRHYVPDDELEEDAESSQITSGPSSIQYVGDLYTVTLLADFEADTYKLVIREN